MKFGMTLKELFKNSTVSSTVMKSSLLERYSTQKTMKGEKGECWREKRQGLGRIILTILGI